MRIGYGKLWIGDEAWLWDEKEEELSDESGRRRREVLEEREGKRERKGQSGVGKVDVKERRVEKRMKGGEGRSQRGGKEKGRRKRSGIYKIAFWNVTGLGNKDRDFWKGLEEWDVIFLCETWIDKKD